MLKNKLREGLKHHKKLSDSFYHFIVDNKIDWAIILGCILSILPYLASNFWYYILIKSIILILIIFLALNYLKTWKAIRDLDGKKSDAVLGLIPNKEINRIGEISEFQSQFSSLLNRLITNYQAKKIENESLSDYLSNKNDSTSELEALMNRDPTLTKSAIGITMAVYLNLIYLRSMPKLKTLNYYKLIGVIILTALFFFVYTIENSYTL